MKNIDKDFFQDLFTAKERPDTRFNISFLFPDVNCSAALDLPVEPQEIKRELFSRSGALKPLGLMVFLLSSIRSIGIFVVMMS